MARRRLRRRADKARRHAPPRPSAAAPGVVIREAARVERLAYTRTEAAKALGVSRSTFDRRVIPLIEVVAMPSGTKLVPIDELERLIEERRQGRRSRPQPVKPGRPPTVAPDVVARIRGEHAEGKSLRDIARDLNASGTPTAHGGQQWWPSTIRGVLRRDA